MLWWPGLLSESATSWQHQRMGTDLGMSDTEPVDTGLLSAIELANMIRKRELGSRELLDHYLERIDRLNGEVNAIVTFDLDRAEQAAANADELTAAGGPLGPLHGLPIWKNS